MYTILGATGNVGGKIAEILVNKGEKVRLVARSADKLRHIVGPGAEAYAGDANDTEFLVKAFTGSDAVFTLLPPNGRADRFLSYAERIGESIARALEIAKVKYVVTLSSLGAELEEGTGPIVGLHRLEQRLNSIKGLNALHLRCAYFMENLLMSIDLIKSRGIIGSAIRGDIKLPMIATKDIAAAAAERLLKKDFSGSAIRELLGQRDLSMIEATSVIGKKLNKSGLTYIMFAADDAEKGMVSAGLSPDMSRLYVEMSTAFNEGRITRAVKRTAQNTTPTSLEEFCDERFVPLYKEKKAA
jgi:uncharacterized protein YbjT (DUF2867 family)